MEPAQPISPFHANRRPGSLFRFASWVQWRGAHAIAAHTRVPPPSGPGRKPPPDPLPEIDPDRMPPPGDDDDADLPPDPDRLPEVDPPSREPPVGLCGA
ncbi:hypothetical protein [Paraburkholderia sp. SUR17]|uniref:hypothetical protein n=1 Tax=Paraburkholderia sp. SUR17 TaxID=3034358 RepID=UPI002407A1B8|nr:hypothetical protein [Paraburkholderia sp. SUR17]WEY42627.1 hypothetical protein P2869_21580 [Paraburkholderia sp. SUR17]